MIGLFFRSEKLETIMCWRIHFCYCTSTKAKILPSIQTKRLKYSYSKIYTSNQILVIFGTMCTERNYKICVVKTTAKMLERCNIWLFDNDFYGQKSSFVFLFKKNLYKKYDTVKKNICWRITLDVTSLTTPPPPFHKGKNIQNLKIVEFSM